MILYKKTTQQAPITPITPIEPKLVTNTRSINNSPLEMRYKDAVRASIQPGGSGYNWSYSELPSDLAEKAKLWENEPRHIAAANLNNFMGIPNMKDSKFAKSHIAVHPETGVLVVAKRPPHDQKDRLLDKDANAFDYRVFQNLKNKYRLIY